MESTHRMSLLFIILISGFKLGITAPADDGIKGKVKVVEWKTEKQKNRKSDDESPRKVSVE